ncbi:MAG TPA: hypothetical protein VFI45_10570 [Candidatus Acidoferrum sp.]|nr:hypothetical protein [Candidatus Acidoferrum sp.]
MNIGDDLRVGRNYYLAKKTISALRRHQNAAKIVPISRFGTPQYQVELWVSYRSIAAESTRQVTSKIHRIPRPLRFLHPFGVQLHPKPSVPGVTVLRLSRFSKQPRTKKWREALSGSFEEKLALTFTG